MIYTSNNYTIFTNTALVDSVGVYTQGGVLQRVKEYFPTGTRNIEERSDQDKWPPPIVDPKGFNALQVGTQNECVLIEKQRPDSVP